MLPGMTNNMLNFGMLLEFPIERGELGLAPTTEIILKVIDYFSAKVSNFLALFFNPIPLFQCNTL
jgi:hypothetical protein